MTVVCCQVEVSATSWSLVQRSPTDCGVLLCDLETWWMRRPWPTAGLLRQKQQMVRVKVSHYRPGQAVRRLRLPEYLDSRHMKVVRLSTLPAAFTLQYICLVLISVRGWFYLRVIVQPGGLCQWKIPVNLPACSAVPQPIAPPRPLYNRDRWNSSVGLVTTLALYDRCIFRFPAGAWDFFFFLRSAHGPDRPCPPPPPQPSPFNHLFTGRNCLLY
jgi:hypothetical protein